MELTPKIKRRLRKKVNATRSCRICIVEGKQRPKLVGEPGHYVTKKGHRRIWYPQAYAKKGFSNMLYCPSTHMVVVGTEWLEKNMTDKDWRDMMAERLLSSGIDTRTLGEIWDDPPIPRKKRKKQNRKSAKND